MLVFSVACPSYASMMKSNCDKAKSLADGKGARIMNRYAAEGEALTVVSISAAAVLEQGYYVPGARYVLACSQNDCPSYGIYATNGALGKGEGCSNLLAIDQPSVWTAPQNGVVTLMAVSYTHLTLPTIYSV